jgi:hypothetical protein
MQQILMNALKVEEDRLDQEQENTHGVYHEMKAVFEKKIQLYKRYLKKEGLTELDRLRLENKKEWQMSHLLGLLEHEDMASRVSELTKRVYRLEKNGGLDN